MAELAALVTPGPFKAKKKDPERMLGESALNLVKEAASVAQLAHERPARHDVHNSRAWGNRSPETQTTMVLA